MTLHELGAFCVKVDETIAQLKHERAQKLFEYALQRVKDGQIVCDEDGERKYSICLKSPRNVHIWTYTVNGNKVMVDCYPLTKAGVPAKIGLMSLNVDKITIIE